MTQRIGVVLLVAVLLVGTWPVLAQGRPDPEPVMLEAPDGQVLVGDYYVPLVAAEDGSPAVLLAHHGSARKERWNDQVPAFLEAGYAVLNIDLRGHGATGGRITEGAQVVSDIALWIDWLRDQEDVDPDAVHLVGASLGGDMSVPVYAVDEALASLTVISPLADIYGVNTVEAFAAAKGRPAFFIATAGDPGSMEAVQAYLGVEGANLMVRVYDTTACCTGLFMLEDDLLPAILSWLAANG
jgi:pimeloyl-ACP methyl ester carboxylesterase